ncbi:MAG: hypothetical protein RIR00_945 [Pseudomonadota bacterium]|jgi:acyl dehydratase
MTAPLFLDDLQVGQRFASGCCRLDAAAIQRFAQEYDPQAFHLDDGEARKSLFQGLAASGWHTAALTMRLLVESEFRPAGGIIGGGLDELRWHQPVRAGDELRLEIEILEIRASRSRPEQGMAKVRVVTLNQHQQPVQTYVGNLVVQRRPR